MIKKITKYMKLGFKVGVPAEFAETPPPTKCHLSIKVTTSTRNMDTMSESFLLLRPGSHRTRKRCNQLRSTEERSYFPFGAHVNQ